MRKATKRLQEKLDEVKASDGHMASELAKMVSYLDKVERANDEKCLAFKAEVDAYHEYLRGELTVMRATINDRLRELRGDDAERKAADEQAASDGTGVVNMDASKRRA